MAARSHTALQRIETFHVLFSLSAPLVHMIPVIMCPLKWHRCDGRPHFFIFRGLGGLPIPLLGKTGVDKRIVGSVRLIPQLLISS